MSDRIPLPWVVSDPNDGCDFFATEAEATNHAENLIDRYLDDTWDEDVLGVFVAKITHGVDESDRMDRDDPRWDDVTGGRSDVESWVNYTVKPMEAVVYQAAPAGETTDG